MQADSNSNSEAICKQIYEIRIMANPNNNRWCIWTDDVVVVVYK